MATWKKIIVSGSNISQLNNDAGYLTAGTLGVKNAFSTASYFGTPLISDSTTGSLNFASSSGQGLTISATAGTDTLTFGLSAIPTSSLLNSGSIIGTTPVNLGTTVSSLAGLTSVTATTFTGTLAGTASWASNATSASFASTAPYSGLTGVPTGIVSASVLSSATQGTAVLTTNGVAGSTIDLGLETTDSPSFAGVTAGNITVGVTNDNTINTTSGDLTIASNVILNNNLTVIGTASFQNTANLQVADRFVLFASGSNTTGDGGIVVQQATQNVGELFGWDSGASRWAVTSSFSADQGAFTPDAFVSLVSTAAGTSPAPASRYNAAGNIYVSSGDESIWIYS
jgi:hypothetical protein